MSPSGARVVAHAKINLALRVLARRADGYHTIETLFARIGLGDLVTVRVRDAGRELHCTGADVGPPERNLALRAATAFAEAVGWPRGFSVEVEKRVPVGGGLGGGSADAGAVLRALAALAPRPVPQDELLRLALLLGSDVPFLTLEAPLALAWERGERLLRLPALPARSVALVLPGFAVATADAYAWVDEARVQAADGPAVLDAGRLARWEDVAVFAANDFEEPVARRHPGLPGILRGLRRSGATIAHLCGSGSSVFGVFEAPPDAAQLSREIPGTIALTETLSRVTPVELID